MLCASATAARYPQYKSSAKRRKVAGKLAVAR